MQAVRQLAISDQAIMSAMSEGVRGYALDGGLNQGQCSRSFFDGGGGDAS
jgi:hypothetical protein